MNPCRWSQAHNRAGKAVSQHRPAVLRVARCDHLLSGGDQGVHGPEGQIRRAAAGRVTGQQRRWGRGRQHAGPGFTQGQRCCHFRQRRPAGKAGTVRVSSHVVVQVRIQRRGCTTTRSMLRWEAREPHKVGYHDRAIRWHQLHVEKRRCALLRRRRLLNICRQSLGPQRFDHLLGGQHDSGLIVAELAPQLRIARLEFSEPLIASSTLRRALGGSEPEALLPAEQPLHR